MSSTLMAILPPEIPAAALFLAPEAGRYHSSSGSTFAENSRFAYIGLEITENERKGSVHVVRIAEEAEATLAWARILL